MPKPNSGILAAHITAALRFADKAYDETLAETHDPNAAIEGWKENLPILASRKDVQAYIACVAVGFNAGWLQADEAKTMLYTAQLQLAALAERGKP